MASGIMRKHVVRLDEDRRTPRKSRSRRVGPRLKRRTGAGGPESTAKENSNVVDGVILD
ncbi:uncharacterized protein RCC_05609 [Ramularia collo-cygni]|uniref:Uncharacterized protein n=1 Tax=Ramularia collo-cygni TaxID=112498 RepID=A0A2D3VAR2_9PEZI|nr:uncharacterized protein RCC_05609 [Ramularia collo-cygni]CZT19754.1 uncharacterized protein RCC_05609 [Ramularia collo-cygni]